MATFHDSALGSASASSVGPLATADALAVTAGDLVVASAKWESGTTTVTFDSGASTPLFTVANAVRQEASGLSICGAVYFWIATATGTINPRFTLAAAKDFREIRAFSITPAAGKTFVLGNVNAADGPSLATAISAGTAAAAGAGVGITAIALNGSRTITPGSGWTEPAELNTSISAHEQYQLISGAGTITGDCTLSSAVEWVDQLALFTEVSTGGAQPPLSGITLNPGGVPTGFSGAFMGKAPTYGVMRWQSWESYPWSAAAVAAIDVASAGVLSITGAAALTATGDMAAAGALTITGAAPLTAAGTVASAGTLFITGAAAATSIGTLASTGTVVINGAAAPTAQGTVAAAGTLVINGAAALTGLGSLAAAGTAVITGASDLTAPSVNDISSAGSLVITSSAALSAVGTLAASGALVITGAATLDDGAVVVTVATPNAGGWPIFALRYEHELARRRRKKREQEELEQESRELQNQLDREIALLLREQEAKDEKRSELERVKALAEHLSAAEALAQYGERVEKALERATIRASYSTLEALDREIQRARQEEEFLVLAFAMLLEDNDA